MAKKTIGLEVDIPVGKAEENVKNLQQRLEELKKTLYDLDEADPSFDKMAREAAVMEDKIADVNQRVKQLSSDTKNLEGFTATVSGIAGGFAAAQGAAALFSDENEEVQKSMLKVQAALTSLNGIQEVANQLNKDSAASIFLKSKAQKAYNLVVGQSTGALKGFKIALAATGIGLIVLTLGAIVANWDKISKAVKENTEGMVDFGEVFNKVKAIAMGVFNSVIAYYKTLFDIIKKAIAGDFTGAIESAKNLGKNVVNAYNEGFKEQVEKTAEEARLKLVEASIGDTKRLLARLQAQGKDVYETRRKLLKDELQLLEKGTEEYLNKKNEIEVLALEREKEIAEKRKEKKDKDLEEEKQKQERIAEIIKDTKKQIELNTLEGQEKELRVLEMAFEEKMAAVKGNEEAERLIQAQYFQERQAIQDEYAKVAREKRDADFAKEQKENDDNNKKKLDDQKAYEEALQDLRVSSTLSLLDTLMSLNDTFTQNNERAAKRAFGVQKALSIAETTISTITSAQKAFENVLANPLFKLSPDGGLTAASIAAGTVVASGLARVAAIAKQEYQSGSTPSIPTGGGGGGGITPAQNTPQISQDVTRTRLGANDQGELNLKVFVTESDITNTQKKVNRIERRATVE